MTKYYEKININDRNSLSILINRIRPGSVVLEFGPAAGRMTDFLMNQLNCKVYAVEIDEDAGKIAKEFTEKIVIDSIENYSWQKEFKGLLFDYIIFADVLEHLYYPEKVLNSVRKFLKEDGSILVSIPNIAHNAIILGLMKNEFNYSSLGLLDDTHIRFFTKQTFDEVILKNGYFVSFETAVFLNPKNTEFKNTYEQIPIEFGEYLSRLPWGEVYQYIYEIKMYEVEKISDFDDSYKIYGKNFIQLFIGDEKDFLEENSIKYIVKQNMEVQKFEFNLRNMDKIKNLRLDPYNDSCVIEIEKLYLLLQNGEKVDLIPYICTNACFYHGKKYFFEFFDPNIYFEKIDLKSLKSIEKLCFEVKYNHIAKDAVHVCANQIAIDKNYKISSLEKENKKFQENLISLKNRVINLEKEKGELQKNLSSSENSVVNLENELLDVYTSKSWKITRLLRNLVKGKV